MPPCHCGKHSAVGVGFNKRPLFLCSQHLGPFFIARSKEAARTGKSTMCAELDVCARILVALGQPNPFRM